MDYTTDKEQLKDMTAKEYSAMTKELYVSSKDLTVAITREEYAKAREHFAK